MTVKLFRSSIILSLTFFASSQGYAQCTNANLNGVLFFTSSGSVKSGTTTASFSESARLTSDGNGNLTGQTTTSTGGVIATLNMTGTYSIQPNCSGTATLTTSAGTTQIALQIVNGGGTTLGSITTSSLGELSDVRFYRAANATGGQCGDGALTGAYGVLLSGGTYAGTTRTAYDVASQIVFNGNGGLTVTGEVTNPTAGGISFSGTGTYTLNADCSGTAQIVLPSGTQNYLLARIAGGNVLFKETDANTTVDGSATGLSNQNVLPQLAFGGGWYSALYFTNTSSVTASFLVTFTADSGIPLSLPGIGTSQQVTLAPQSTTIIEALNQGNTLLQGYASFALPAGVNGYGVFRQIVPGSPNQEAVVGFKDATATAVSMTYDDTAFTTSVALVNPSAVATTVNITVWDSKGNLVGTSQQSLAAGTKIEAAMRGFAGLSGMAGLRGSALFTVQSGNVQVLGLRFGTTAFTSIPTNEEQ